DDELVGERSDEGSRPQPERQQQGGGRNRADAGLKEAILARERTEIHWHGVPERVLGHFCRRACRCALQFQRRIDRAHACLKIALRKTLIPTIAPDSKLGIAQNRRAKGSVGEAQHVGRKPWERQQSQHSWLRSWCS